MSITISQLKKAVLKSELEFLVEAHVFDGDDEQPSYLESTKEDINSCGSIDDLVAYYEGSGYSIEEGYANIIAILMKEATLKAK